MMNKKKITLFALSGALLLGTAFSAIFGLAKQNEFKANIALGETIEEKISYFQEKYKITDFSNKESITAKGIDEVSKYANKLLVENKIESYVVNSDSVIFHNKCGVTMVFKPTLEGTYGDDDKPVLNITKVLPNQMIFSEASQVTEGQPLLPDGFHNDGELIPAVAQDIANEFDHITYDTKDLEQDIPLHKEFLQKLGPNQVVIMLGHGTYVEGYHSTLNTGRQFSWSDFQNDPTYREDCRNGLIIDTSGGEAFTTRYIDKYVGDLTNTFIYFGECESAKDSALANSFLYKGAAALIANTEAISMRYGDMMQYATLKHLLDKHNDGTYWTIEEALAKAKETYGECDPAPGSAHSVPTLFGNPNYSLDKALVAPVLKTSYTYTGEEIEFVKPGVGFHVEINGEYVDRGTDVDLYFCKVVLEDGYKWPDPETTPTMVYAINIIKKPVTFEDIVIPVAKDNITTDGRNVELFTKGESDLGTFEYFLEGSEEYYWSEKIPQVNKPGTYKIAWRFIGDKNHGDLGGYNEGFVSEVTVKAAPSYSTVPAWLIVVLCVIGAALVVTLTILTGKKVKKLSKEK